MTADSSEEISTLTSSTPQTSLFLISSLPQTNNSKMVAKQPLWLRCEKKPFEHRSALTPTTAKKLLDAGFDIYVERDPQRIFDDEEFEA